MSSVIKSARDGAVLTITLDRPSEGNLLAVDMVRELTAAMRAAAVPQKIDYGPRRCAIASAAYR